MTWRNDALRFPANDRPPHGVVILLPSIAAELSAALNQLHEDRQG